jgi:hypothetical protein
MVPLNGPDECMRTISGNSFTFITHSMKNYRSLHMLEMSVEERNMPVKQVCLPLTTRAFCVYNPAIMNIDVQIQLNSTFAQYIYFSPPA